MFSNVQTNPYDTMPVTADSSEAKPPRVLFVGAFVATTAGSRAASLLTADELDRRDWTTLRTSTSQNRAWRLAEMLQTIFLERQAYDVAHVDLFSGSAFLWAEAACAALHLLGRPYVLTMRGGGLPKFSAKRVGRVRRLLASAAAVTAPSQFLVDAMAPYCDRIELVPNALVLSRYRHRVRTKVDPKIVWVRAFHELYRPVHAVEALARVAQTYPGAKLTMVGADKGDGSLERTRRRAEELGLTDRVEVTGGVPKSHIPGLLDQHDIFLNTTSVDNTPVSMLEAMVSGLCVVSTNVGGIPYLAEHRSTAMLAPPDDPAALASCIEDLLSDPELAGQLSRGGKSRVAAYDWSRVLPVWTELFWRAANTGRESYVLD